jgi:hypothetical protein
VHWILKNSDKEVALTENKTKNILPFKAPQVTKSYTTFCRNDPLPVLQILYWIESEP